MNKLIIICIIALTLIFSSVPSYGAINGITAENYLSYEKPIEDAYGYNKGECDREYIAGEEYFYNEYYDHWNIDKVYDETLIPANWGKVNTDKAKAQKNKKSKKAKKNKKSKKAKKK